MTESPKLEFSSTTARGNNTVHPAPVSAEPTLSPTHNAPCSSLVPRSSITYGWCTDSEDDTDDEVAPAPTSRSTVNFGWYSSGDDTDDEGPSPTPPTQAVLISEEMSGIGDPGLVRTEAEREAEAEPVSLS